MGVVTDWVRRKVPGSYDAIIGATEGLSQGDVQALADYVKFRLFATTVDVTSEASYDPRLAEFLGKLTTLQFIPAAVDFWGRQIISESATGTNENTTYPDRRTDLWKIFEEISNEVKSEWNAMAQEYGFRVISAKAGIPKISYGDNGKGVLLTNDPYDIMTAPYLVSPWKLPPGIVWDNGDVGG